MQELELAERRLAALARGRAHQLLGWRLLLLLSGAAAILLIGGLADWLSAGLSAGWRWFFALVLVLVLPVTGGWAACIAARKLTPVAVAALLSRLFPQHGDALLNALLLQQRGGVAADMVQAVLRENRQPLAQLRASSLYSPLYRRWGARLAAGVAGLWLLALLAGGGGLLTGSVRILLPFSQQTAYTATRIDAVSPGACQLKRGDKLAVEAHVSGQFPEEVRLVLDQPGAPRFQQVLEAAAGTAAYAGSSPAAFADFRYRLEAGDAVSRWYAVEVVSPPALSGWEARIVPPAAAGLVPYTLLAGGQEQTVPEGAQVTFRGTSSQELRSAELWLDDARLAAGTLASSQNFALSFVMPVTGRLELRLRGAASSALPMPLQAVADRPPKISLVDTPLQLMAQPGEPLAVGFRAEDDYGVARVGLERVADKGRPEQIRVAVPETGSPRQFPGRFLLDTGSFAVIPGRSLRLRVWAEDQGRTPELRRGYSAVLTVTFPSEQKVDKEQEGQLRSVEAGLNGLIRLQKEVLQETRVAQEQSQLGRPLPDRTLASLEERQGEVRAQAVALLAQRETLGGLADVLAGLVNLEMAEVLGLFDGLPRAAEADRAELLRQCTLLQNAILAALSGLSAALPAEQNQRERKDLFALIQKLVRDQQQMLRETGRLQAGETVVRSALVHNQDMIAEGILRFADSCLRLSEIKGGSDGFAEQVRLAHTLLRDEKAYEHAIEASELLDGKKEGGSLQAQGAVLRSLLNTLNLLNAWRAANARKILQEAAEVLRESGEVLEQLEKTQARVAEVTRELFKRGVLDEEAREQLGKLDREQKEMADLLEKLANDLYQFPELPVCQELNSKAREIYEDVLQAMDSENTPALEIAVQKEDGILEAIRKTKERVEDVEMWLMDIPDNIVWNMESFDTDEFPDIPLVPLPDELEDIVGELLDQASEIEAQSQDTTGNNIVADAEMGWGVMDGPMPSFAAKGKSGNTRPNDNEMTGRSGSGREGQSSGELVENHVKGYEGRKTHARRTQEQLQKGLVTEDENSTLDARATGGGKLGGESETIGMFGSAPRRDLHTGSHGAVPQRLRQETEALYATARLLYIGSGGLGEAARELRGLENAPPRLQELGGLRRRVMRRLEDSQVELREGVILPMAVNTVKKDGGNAAGNNEWGTVADEYKELLNDYYRSLNQ